MNATAQYNRTVAGNVTATVIEPTQPEIGYEVGQLRFMIEQLEGACQSLQEKLGSIVAVRSAMTSQKEIPVGASKTKLGGEIRCETQRLHVLKETLVTLVEQIEL